MNKSEMSGYQNKKPFHFLKTLAIALSLILAAWASFYLFLGNYSENDRMAYERLVKGEEEAKSYENHVSKQRRIGLQKNFFFNDNHQRFEFKMKSAQSELALEKIERSIEVVEHMEDVVCWLQEDVYFVLPDGRKAFSQKDGRLLIKGSEPKESSSWISGNASGLIKEQTILMLTAKNATYHYKGGGFKADNVKILRYITSNPSFDEMPSAVSLITEGTASKVEFSLGEKGLDFKADNFKANFFMKSGIS